MEVANSIVKRAILIKSIIDVISEADSYEQMILNVNKEKLYPILESQKSFRFNIEGIGKKIDHAQQNKIIDSFEVFPFEPNINL